MQTPPEVFDLADVKPNGVAIRRPDGRVVGTTESWGFGIALVGLASLASGGVAAFYDGVAVVPAMLTTAGATVLVYSLALAALDTSWLRIGPGGVSRSGIVGMRARPVQQVSITGDVGHPIVLAADGEPLIVEVPEVGGWTYPALVWLAHRTATLTGAELFDGLNHANWTRYHEDPTFRASIHVEREVATNRSVFPHLHEDRTFDLSMRLDGYEGEEIAVTRDSIADGSETLPLASVDSVDPIYWLAPRGPTDPRRVAHGALLVRSGDRVVRIGTRQMLGSLVHRKLMSEVVLVREQALRARAEQASRGSASDIPEALGDLRRS